MSDFAVIQRALRRCLPPQEIEEEIKNSLSLRKRQGWLRAIRHLLQLSSKTMAKRMKISQQSYSKLEKNEEEGLVSFRKLEAAADALGYEVVYFLRPKSGLMPLEELASEMLSELPNEVGHEPFRSRRLAYRVATKFCDPKYRKSKGWANNPKGVIAYRREWPRDWDWPDRVRSERARLR